MKSLISYAEIAKDFIQSSIDSTVTAVEQIHLSIADTAVNTVTSKSTPNKTLQSLHDRHKATAQGIYEAIRSVNRSLGELASDGFEALENSEIAAKMKKRP